MRSCSGPFFVWSVIENKWPGFEEAFLGFEPRRLLFQPEDFWHELTRNPRIVRNGAKIMAVRANAKFVSEIAAEHGSFGRFLAALAIGELPYTVATVWLGAGFVTARSGVVLAVGLAIAALSVGAFHLLRRRLRAYGDSS